MIAVAQVRSLITAPQPLQEGLRDRFNRRVVANKSKVTGNLWLGCPVFKHKQMHHDRTSCSGSPLSTISEVTKHLNRHHRYQLDLPLFLRECESCNKWVTHAPSWKQHHSMGQCCDAAASLQNTANRSDPTAVEQIVEDRWERLYRTLYPENARIPSPCTLTPLPDCVSTKTNTPEMLGTEILGANSNRAVNRHWQNRQCALMSAF